jgi:hypothetical protein
MIAWREREEAWQPRTYRALLEGEKYDSVLIDDPKTKALRELVPFKQAQQLLKKKGIDLPSYANRKRHDFQRPKTKTEDPAAAQRRAEKEESERAEAELQRKVEDETVERLLKLVHEKWNGPMKRDDLELVAEYLQQDWDIGQKMLKILGKRPSIATMNERDLGRLIVAVVALQLVEGGGLIELKATAKRLKIDPKAIEKEIRAELTKVEKKAKSK